MRLPQTIKLKGMILFSKPIVRNTRQLLASLGMRYPIRRRINSKVRAPSKEACGVAALERKDRLPAINPADISIITSARKRREDEGGVERRILPYRP